MSLAALGNSVKCLCWQARGAVFGSDGQRPVWLCCKPEDERPGGSFWLSSEQDGLALQ